LTRFAEFFGLAFQIADDLLDAESSTEVTGKITGRDRARQKATFPAVLGLSATRERVAELLENAVAELRPFGRSAQPLSELAQFIVGRALGQGPSH
jgi:geranylgeranyl diphosphate synthase type II